MPSRLVFEKNFKKIPPYIVFKKFLREVLLEYFIPTIYFIRIFYFIQNLFYNTYIHLFFMWPPGGGACRFLYRDNNMMQVICKLLFVGAESLFYLAVLDCVKPDIDQVASVVYCMIE
jgi:hypothetical protein